MGDLKGAGEALERALALNPQHSAAWISLGFVKVKLKREREAVFCYEQSAALGDPVGQQRAQQMRLMGFKPRAFKIPPAP